MSATPPANSSYGLLILHISGDCELSFGRLRQAPCLPGRDEKRERWVFKTVNTTLGKGFAADRSYLAGQHSVRDALIIPCAEASVSAIEDYLALQDLMADLARPGPARPYGGYYFTQSMARHPDFDTSDTKPRGIGGPFTAYAQAFEAFDESVSVPHSYEIGNRAATAPKNPKSMPMARYNCWTAAQGMAQYVGDIDLSRIDARLPHLYRAAQAQSWLHRFFMQMRSTAIAAAGVMTAAQKENTPDTVPFYIDKNHDGMPAAYGTIMARQAGQPDAPPFLLQHNSAELIGSILAKRTENGLTIDETLRRGAAAGRLLTPTRLETHSHMAGHKGLAP